MIRINVNGVHHTVDVEPDTPLLWVLRDALGLTGTKYGCGIAQCGTCTVHVGGQPTRACVLPVGSVGDMRITTIEGLHPEGRHALQLACQLPSRYRSAGCCQSGQIMSAAALLAARLNPPMRTSTPPRWRGTCAVAAPTHAFGTRSSAQQTRAGASKPRTVEGTVVSLARREFLALSGALCVGVALPARAGAVKPLAAGKAIPLTAYVVIEPGGLSALSSRPCRKWGRAPFAAHAAIVADELGVDYSMVRVETAMPADPYRHPGPGGAPASQSTGGSWGVRRWYGPLRKGAAQAREMLIAVAAARSGLAAAEFAVSDGVVNTPDFGGCALYALASWPRMRRSCPTTR